jgi:hypothetical protein
MLGAARCVQGFGAVLMGFSLIVGGGCCDGHVVVHGMLIVRGGCCYSHVV